ncbi:tryptophan halogenase family protein [Marinimicrobium alkaliphilum]|uniref:tryptophan halogenase family protein n=1 Tax=Marinimicrobium alkaliphilum TaxID=2202654 RepID=UPI000DBA7BC3|nr:tryptophan halogenase family protein [Marinimicrobium alkaliphilum]
MSKPLHIVIAGGGTAGWMAANLFIKQWGAAQISLVESPDIGIIGVGEGSTPHLRRFFEAIDLTEKEWMPRCNATYKCNIRFIDWSPASGHDHYSHPFFNQVDALNQAAFFNNCMSRRLGHSVHTHPDDFFLGTALAQAGKAPIAPEHFPFDMSYGYHFDSHLLGQYLADVAVSRGVVHVSDRIVQVQRNDSGDIGALHLESGQVISGDLFVDCTGFASLLMQQTLQVPFKSFKENLFNDRAVVMRTPMAGAVPVETRATALSAGWCWKIPLTNRFGNGYVYSSDFISEDEAEREFRAHLGLPDSADNCRHLKMRVGQLEQHWVHNCLSLGLSQGFIEPLEATALHLVQVAIEGFIRRFEQGQFSAQYRDEFNRSINEHFERVRDYIVGHYKLNTREDSDYWRANRNNDKLSDAFLEVIEGWFNYKSITSVLRERRGVSQFDAQSWHCLLAGYGTFPAVTKGPPPRGDRYRDTNVANVLRGSVLNFPDHLAALASLTSAESEGGSTAIPGSKSGFLGSIS